MRRWSSAYAKARLQFIAHLLPERSSLYSTACKLSPCLLDNLHKDAMDSLMREFRGSLKLFIHLASFVVRAGRGDAQLLTDMAQKFRTFMEPRQRADRKANPPDRRQLASGSGQQSSSAGGDGKRQPEGAKPKYPIGYGAIEEICQKLDSKELLQGSSDLFMTVNVPQLFQRLDELWPHADKQEKLLRAIVAAASASSSDLLSMTHDFLMKVGCPRLSAATTRI